MRKDLQIKQCQVIIDDTNGYIITIKKGSVVDKVKPSGKDMLSLRDKYCDEDKITLKEDISFKSLSGAASFIQGARTNGNRYFDKYLKTANNNTSAPDTTISSSNQPKPKVKKSVSKDTAQKKTRATPTKPVSNSGLVKLTKSEYAQYSKQFQALTQDIKSFYKDFNYTVDNRQMNTLLTKEAPDFMTQIKACMLLSGVDENVLSDLDNKSKSIEWETLNNRIIDWRNLGFTKAINERLVIYFGAPGQGKSTAANALAMQHDNLTDLRNVLTFQASMGLMAEDLFSAYNPVSKRYELTALGIAARDGRCVIIDEVNNLSPDCLRVLQTLLDNSKTLNDNHGFGNIEIKPGFMVIFTMNEKTNDGRFTLPDALISRAFKVVNFNSDKTPEWVGLNNVEIE